VYKLSRSLKQILQFSPHTISKRRFPLAACQTSSDSCNLSHVNFTSCPRVSWKNRITAEKMTTVTICNKTHYTVVVVAYTGTQFTTQRNR